MNKGGAVERTWDVDEGGLMEVGCDVAAAAGSDGSPEDGRGEDGGWVGDDGVGWVGGDGLDPELESHMVVADVDGDEFNSAVGELDCVASSGSSINKWLHKEKKKRRLPGLQPLDEQLAGQGCL